MTDPRIIDYIRQNMGKYPIESLKQALIKQGYAPEVIDGAVQAVNGAPAGAPPMPDAPAAEGYAGDPAAVTFSAGQLFSNAKRLYSGPEDFFSHLDPQGPFGPAVLNVLLWALISGIIFGAIAFIGAADMFGKIAAVAQIVVFPIVAVAFSFIGAGVYHVICKVLGGQAPFRGSYQVVAGIAAVFPLSAVASALPLANILVQIYGLYLSVQSAAGMHKVGKMKAWIAFGVLTLLGIVGSIAATVAAKRLKELTAQQAGTSALALPAPQAGAMLQDLQKFQEMQVPPQELLSILAPAGQTKLNQAWPTMSAPIRKAMVETLPTVGEGEREAALDRMVMVNQNMGQAMGAIQNLLQQQKQGTNPPGDAGRQ